MVKKAKKQIVNMLDVSLISASGSMALGSLGGTVAGYGQAGISGAMGFAPSIGSMVGTGMLMRTVQGLERTTKPRKRKRRKKR